MNILRFLKEYGTEQKCKEHFRLQREKQGVICKKCSSSAHYWLAGKEQWQCKQCKFRTTLKSGTIMEESKLSFLIWYEVIAFMSFRKKGVSAKEMQRQLGHSRYQSIWKLMHKVRIAMGNRDARYQLSDMVEMDEGYFRYDEQTKTPNKQGKGSKRVKNTAVLVESTPVENMETGQVSNHCRYFKMKVLDNHKAAPVLNMLQENVHETTILFSDKSTTYAGIDKIIEGHVVFKSSRETTTRSLRWVHIAIANARRCFDRIYKTTIEKTL